MNQERLSEPGSHDAHRPPRPVEGKTCHGCIHLSYHRTVVREGKTIETGVGHYSCRLYAITTTARETPRPEHEGCYSEEG